MFPFYHHPLRTLELNTYRSVLQPPPAKFDFNAFPICQVKDKVKVGRWEQWERFAFLRGLRMYGRGKWKKISKLIPTRNTIQVKTHAQVVLKRLQEGEDIFSELDNCSRHILDCCHGSEENKQFYGIHEVSAASALLSLRHKSDSTTTEDTEDSVDD